MLYKVIKGTVINKTPQKEGDFVNLDKERNAADISYLAGINRIVPASPEEVMEQMDAVAEAPIPVNREEPLKKRTRKRAATK